MTRFDGDNLLKRRLRDAGIVGDYFPHSFRATGITHYLENGGTLEIMPALATAGFRAIAVDPRGLGSFEPTGTRRSCVAI